MIRTISSGLTFFYKFIFTPIWITGFGFGTIAMFWRGSVPGKSNNDLVFPVAWIIGSLFLLWGCGRLKRVRLDDKALYISNFIQEIEVPLREVSDISENRWINIHPITLIFKNRTQFGSSVVFMPKARFSIFSSHPVVAEIREAISRVKKK